MTVLEQRFMEQVPGPLHDIAKSLQTISAARVPEYVWVFTAEQAWDGDVADTIVKVFGTEESARSFMHDFIYNGGDESIADYVSKREWDVEIDEPDLYRAFSPGYYPTSHIECSINKCKIE